MINQKTLCIIHAEPNQTVIRATHRNQYLIPAFIDVLKDTPEYTPFYDQIPAYAAEDSEADFWDSETAGYILEELFETLDSYAPDGFYFGAHPGDGSDYGYWEIEEDLKVDSLKIAIDRESLNIYIDNGDEEEPTHICYWHIDEVIEDNEVMFSMMNAIQLFYTDPKKLLYLLHS